MTEKKKPRPRRRPARTPVTYETVVDLGLRLAGVEESTSYGTPALKVGGRLLARLKEDGSTLVVCTDFQEREALMAADPEVFYITDHYLNYPAILVRLSRVGREKLAEVLEKAWRQQAPARFLSARKARRR